MKNGSFHALQRLVALATTSALLFNIVGCGLHNSKPTYSHFFEDEDDDGDEGDEGDEGSDSDSATESPHVTDTDVNSVSPEGNKVQIGGTSRTEGKTQIVDFFEVSSQSDGSVKAPGSGVTNHAQEPASQGPSPSAEGSPFAAGSTKPQVAGTSRVPRVGGHDEGRGNRAPEERRVYPSPKEFKDEVHNDRKLLEQELGGTSAASQVKLQEAEKSVAKAIETHNAEVDKALAAVPGWEALVTAGSNPSGFKTPSTSPTGQALRNARLSIQYTKATVPGAPADVLQMAEQTLAAADEAAANGNVNDAESRRRAAWDLINVARCPSCLPQPPKKGSYELQATTSEQSEKSKSVEASKDLFNAANDLDKNGFPGFANDARKAATQLLNISLGLARVVTIIDIPLNILEAFAQKTIEFDESGSPQIVEASGIEVAFALGTLAFVAAGAVTVGWQAALGAGIIAGLGKTVEKGMVKHAAEKAALEIAEKGAVGTEKAAIEQAAKEAAEAEANGIVRDAGRAAGSSTMKNVSTKARAHILEGDFNAAGQLKGGLHTGQATDRMISRLPAEVQEKITRETLANGVERTVFRAEDKVLTDGAYDATVEAAKGGRGFAGGKTSFPRNWTPETIDAAIGQVSKNGQVISSKANGMAKLEGSFEGVKVEVNVGPQSGGGTQVNSAYPSWNQ